MIFTYNKEHVGDVLMVIVKNSGDAKLDVERKGNVARVFLKETGETVAWNIFEVSSMFEIAEPLEISWLSLPTVHFEKSIPYFLWFLQMSNVVRVTI